MVMREIFAGWKAGRTLPKEMKDIEESLSSAIAKGENSRVYMLLNMAGRVADTSGDHDGACAYYLRAASYGDAGNSGFGAGWSMRLAAQCMFSAGDYRKAVSYALEAAALFEKAKSLHAAQWSYSLAGKAAAARNDFCSAIKYYSAANSIVQDDRLEETISEMKKKVPHPVIDYWLSSDEAKEGEQVRFDLIIGNRCADVIRNIKVCDESGNVMGSIEKLYPRDEKVVSISSTCMKEGVRSRFRTITWETGGQKLEDRLRSFRVSAVPNVRVTVKIEPKLRLGKPSDFIFMIKNLSTEPVKDVAVKISFPPELGATSKTPVSFKSIGRHEEKGVIFELVPSSIGECFIRDAKVSYVSDNGREFTQAVKPIILRGSLEEPMELPENTTREIAAKIGEEGFKRLERARQKKKCLSDSIVPYPMHEHDYTRMAANLPSFHTGFMLSGVGPEDIAEHVLGECGMFSLVEIHEAKREKLLLFSGRAAAGERNYLLTVGIRPQEKSVSVLFKIYSTEEEGLESTLTDIADVVRYILLVMKSAREVEKIEVNEVINIIDSIVQRSRIGAEGGLRSSTVSIKDSIVQRSMPPARKPREGQA